MSIEQAQFTYSQQIELTEYVNAYRAKHGSPPLEWDDTITQFAQEYSLYLAANSLFQHSNKEGYGENLAYFQGYPNEMMSLIKKSIDLWYDEIKLYNYNYPGYSPGTGHFTCLIWKSSTKFGMGYSYNNDTKIVDVTMNTAPPGNVIGQFPANVLPLLDDTPDPAPVPDPVPDPDPAPVPDPVPDPDPATDPDPAPVPDPLPDSDSDSDPEPEPEYINQIIYSIYALMQMIRQKQPRYRVIYMLDKIIIDIQNIDTTVLSNKYYIVNRLYYVRYAVRTRRRPRYIIQTLNEIIQMLSYNV